MNARFVLSTSAMALAGCAAVAGIGDIELTDPPPASPSSSASSEPAASAAVPSDDASAPPADASVAIDAAVDASIDAPIEAAADAADDAPPVVVDPDPADDPVGPTRCTPGDFLANDRRDPAAERTITFPILAGYDPHCMMIRAGQSVTFSGDFTAYPLGPRGTSPAPNPIVLTTSGTSATFTFANRGRYRYGSPGATMRGAIEVRP